MKNLFLYTLVFLFSFSFVFISCKKVRSCEGCGSNPPDGNTNKPPVAVAGADQVLTLPTDSILLNGSASSDPENNITSYLWTKISGPVSFNIANSNSVQTKITNLKEGVYQFELKVTDAGGLLSRDSLQLSVNATNRTVYVAGYEYNGTYVVKKYWKNGMPVTLNYTDPAFVSGIAVSGTDVYVSAYEFNGTHYVAKYCKNGNPIALTDGTHDAYTTGIAVMGSDVYVSGYEFDGTEYSFYDDDGNLVYSNHTRAKYWKNGMPVTLTDSNHSATAKDIGVVGGDVYVAGGENGVIKYWKNGNPVALPASSEAIAIAMSISGSDVYVLGYDGNNLAGRLIVKYWKNGTPIIFSDGSIPILVTDIVVSGSDIYVTGSEYDGTNDVGKYWKNGNPIQLSGNIPVACAIAVIGSDAYVAGYDHSGISLNVYGRVAKYWKNGSHIGLNDGSQWSYTIGIAVTQ